MGKHGKTGGEMSAYDLAWREQDVLILFSKNRWVLGGSDAAEGVMKAEEGTVQESVDEIALSARVSRTCL